MNLEYRVMTSEDFGLCARELMAAFKQAPWNENWTYEQAYTRIDEIMSAKVSRGYVIYERDKVISMLCGRIMTYLDFKELWIDEFSVHPNYQRRGIGGQMLEFVRSEMKKENIYCMVLNTERTYPSVKFYEKNGFKQDDSLVFMTNTFK